MYSTKLKPSQKIEIVVGDKIITIKSVNIPGQQVRVLIDASKEFDIKKLDEAVATGENFNSEEGSNSWHYRNR